MRLVPLAAAACPSAACSLAAAAAGDSTLTAVATAPVAAAIAAAAQTTQTCARRTHQQAQSRPLPLDCDSRVAAKSRRHRRSSSIANRATSITHLALAAFDRIIMFFGLRVMALLLQRSECHHHADCCMLMSQRRSSSRFVYRLCAICVTSLWAADNRRLFVYASVRIDRRLTRCSRPKGRRWLIVVSRGVSMRVVVFSACLSVNVCVMCTVMAWNTPQIVC